MKPIRRLVASDYFKPVGIALFSLGHNLMSIKVDMQDKTKWVPSEREDPEARQATWSDFEAGECLLCFNLAFSRMRSLADELIEPPILG